MIILETKYLELVKSILKAHLPEKTNFFIFGSRVNGPIKPHSDLDIAVDAFKPLTLQEQSILMDAFEASNLPIRVDIVDLNSIAPEFKKLVLKTGERLLTI